MSHQVLNELVFSKNFTFCLRSQDERDTSQQGQITGLKLSLIRPVHHRGRVSYWVPLTLVLGPFLFSINDNMSAHG